jgi:hypothetical protein
MIELILHMKRYNIEILCLQETRISDTDVYEEQGFLIILSGTGQERRSWAGVGFIVSPRMMQRIKSYKQIDDRMCSLKVKVHGGVLGIITACAPHNLKPLVERFQFFTNLDREFRMCSANVDKFVFGDLNSRIGAQKVGEADVIGMCTFGREAVHKVEVPNRDLLLEFCVGNSLVVANTFIPGMNNEKATFMEAGSFFLGEVTETGYNMLDLMLCQASTLERISRLASERSAALGTDHYMVQARLKFDTPLGTGTKHKRRQTSALADDSCRSLFAQAFADMVTQPPSDSTISNCWSHGKDAMKAASECMPQQACTASHPWISHGTLELIEARREARSQNNSSEEKRLHHQIKKEAKRDRSRWLNSLLESGDWKQIRKLRQTRKVNCRRLRNMSGELVESDRWADTMADHLEHVQWRVRPVGAVDGPKLGEELPVSTRPFTEQEVVEIVTKQRKNKASGRDDIPAEYWQAAISTPAGLTWLTDFCNKCWEEEDFPMDWCCADVVALFKKGCIEDPDNYRPISLVCVAYKIFAALVLARLQDGGIEDRLTKSQFGFRRKRGTNDGIFAVRRHIDLALAQRYGSKGILALDWKKAFDSISPEALNVALNRFGLPAKLQRIVEQLYSGRQFSVRDGGCQSTLRAQRSGISQGCPLSPLLFTITMSVIVQDAIDLLPANARAQFDAGALSIILYADDTLLVGSSSESLQQLLDNIATVGLRFGMELHWAKFQLLQLGGQYELRSPDGVPIEPTHSMKYLGNTLHDDGGLKTELGKKLGVAWSDFSKLSRVWQHAQMTRRRKIEVFQSLIVSRLLYGLSTAWLNVAEVRRLNGFQARCLRPILGIKPAYFSRVSNATVLQQAGQIPLGKQLQKQQLLLYGKVARSPAADPLRELAFCPGTLRPATSRYVRRVGRPRNEWTVMLEKRAYAMTPQADRVIHNVGDWRAVVQEYCAA